MANQAPAVATFLRGDCQPCRSLKYCTHYTCRHHISFSSGISAQSPLSAPRSQAIRKSWPDFSLWPGKRAQNEWQRCSIIGAENRVESRKNAPHEEPTLRNGQTERNSKKILNYFTLTGRIWGSHTDMAMSGKGEEPRKCSVGINQSPSKISSTTISTLERFTWASLPLTPRRVFHLDNGSSSSGSWVLLSSVINADSTDALLSPSNG